jgi:hypothetical protein
MSQQKIHIYVYELNEANCFVKRRGNDHLIQKEHPIYLIRDNLIHYNYTKSIPIIIKNKKTKKTINAPDQYGETKGGTPNVAPILVLSIFVLFMAAVSG